MALSEYAQQTALTALNQLGGHASINMMLGIKKTLGAAYFIDEKENKDVRIQFDFKADNAPNIHRVVITYVRDSDLYNMELWKPLSNKVLEKTIGWSVDQLAEKYRVSYYQGIYADQLSKLFCEDTGLTLSPPRFL